MIGDDYFHLRGQLSSAIGELRRQAEALGSGIESLIILDNVQTSLTEPFVFVVVGEVNVGKSTFLNALFGQDFSRTGIVPTTEKILFFKHGPSLATVPITPTLEEVQVPCDFLKDFHIVDTPGTNSIQDEHQQITERFVPIADLVIFVFSASNPWGASAWQFLEKVHREWMRNVIFVIQQCDLRTPEEIQVITDYMRQLTRQRFGREFPLFPVSAKQAYLARSSGTGSDQATLLNQSGFPVLEKFISTSVTQTAGRHTKLLTALNLARQSLTRLQHRLIESYQSIQRRSATLQELITERELQMERTLQKIRPAIDATERDYHESAIRVAGLAADSLSTRRAFKGVPDEDAEEEVDVRQSQPSLDHRLFQDLQYHNSDRWRQVAMVLDEDVRHYERYVHATGRTAFPPEADPAGPQSDELHLELRRHFTSRVQSAIRRFVVGLHLDQTIEPGIKKAARNARYIPRLIAPIVIATGATFYFADAVSAAAVAAAGALCLISFYLLTKAALATARRQLIDKLDDSSRHLHELLTNQVTEDVQAAFSHFLDLLVPAKQTTDSREKNLEQQTSALAELDSRFADIEKNLRALPTTA
jgi:small GTP-binding protein